MLGFKEFIAESYIKSFLKNVKSGKKTKSGKVKAKFVYGNEGKVSAK